MLKYNKYTVIKNTDINKLSLKRQITLHEIVYEIKNNNKYIVINQDEPYADKVWDLIKQNELKESETNGLRL